MSPEVRNLIATLAALGTLAACSSTTPGDDVPYGSGQQRAPGQPDPTKDDKEAGQDATDPSGGDSTGINGTGDSSGNGKEGCNNGFDEDGDGEIDEGCPCDPGSTQYCYVGDLAYGGIGACVWGTQTCQPNANEFDIGYWGPCEGYGEPSEDVCDGQDNDCNGMIDEDCACQPGSVQNCGSAVGLCEYGEQQCTANGNWGPCVGGVGPKAEECNGLDDNCNGYIDEGVICQCMPGMYESCGISTGACAKGVRTCQDDGTWSDCIGAIGPKPETCNGADDDCDGVVDPGCQCTSGSKMPCNLYPNVGICHDGQIVCQNGTWSTCSGAQGPQSEVCDDGLDNDCNGEVDEGCTITLSLKITGLDNNALFEDCLYVRIDGGVRHFVGCNHDPGIQGKQVDIQLAGPACYEVGLEMTIDNGTTVRTVAAGGAEAYRWKVYDQTPIRVEFEDNADNDYDDFQFTVDMDRTYFGLEGYPIGCT